MHRALKRQISCVQDTLPYFRTMMRMLFLAAFVVAWGLVTGQTPSPSEWTIAELVGLNEPSCDPAFAPIPASHSSRSGLYLRTPARDAFMAMAAAADQDGIRLVAVSAARNFSYQNGIWNRKWSRPQYAGWSDVEKAQDILKYSAMPGSSRHHWGTEVDLNSLENAYFSEGEGRAVAEWLDAHAASFGFHLVYTADPRRPGYLPERWHWSYMPLSVPMLAAYNECVELSVLQDLDVAGMAWADSLRILTDFVNGIDEGH